MVFISNKAYSQNGLFLLGGNEFADITNHYRFQQGGHILQRNFQNKSNSNSSQNSGIIGQIAWNVKLHYRFDNNFGLEVNGNRSLCT
jgi:hypothetical protein